MKREVLCNDCASTDRNLEEAEVFFSTTSTFELSDSIVV